MNRRMLALLIVCLGGSFLHAEVPSTGTSKPAKDKDTITVKRGTIAASIDADGYFDAIDPLEVRIKPKQYQGELTILTVPAHGSSVKAGQTLIEIDPKEINRQIAAADNELLSAQANADKAKADSDLGEQAAALALKMEQDELARAHGALKWFDDVDGKQMLKQTELNVTQLKNSVEDQQDELDQLKKMYKSEELTSATADIVVKRAIRNLEISKIHLGMSQDRNTKVKDFDFTNARQKLLFSIDQEKQQLAQLQTTQAHAKVTRQTALNAAKAALEKAQQKSAELKEDLNAFTVKAPSDGVVIYGQLMQGQWQNSGPRALRVGEKVQPSQVLAMFFTPGKLRFVIDVPEAKTGMLKSGAEARIVPTALPEATSTGTCGTPAPTGYPKEAGIVFPTPVELSSIDPRLIPGEKGAAHVDLGTMKDVLIVPVAAVQRGRVRVPGDDGKDSWKNVVCGATDGESIEIKSGLNEGDEIFAKAAK